MRKLAKHFEDVTRRRIPIHKRDLIGWFSFGGNNRVKHYYIKTVDNPEGVSLCGGGYAVGNLTASAAKRINPNPVAPVRKKCAMCSKKISVKKLDTVFKCS